MTTTTSAKIVADSVSPAGHRLTTFECTFPRIILAEVNTHKMLSKNSASSRAIPVEKMIARVLEDPYVPTHWGKNQRGMSADEDVSDEVARDAAISWNRTREFSIVEARWLSKLGIHKQITNRLLEPFMWHVALCSGTEWSNFFNLRDNKDAHPDFRDLAHAMRELYGKGEPSKKDYCDWHTPLVKMGEVLDEHPEAFARGKDHWQRLQEEYWCKVSAGRCARVSHDKQNEDETLEKSVARCEMMLASGHMSPFEHVARPMNPYELDLFKQAKIYWDGVGWAYSSSSFPAYTHFLGNLNGWVQYRKLIPHEDDILGARS